MVGYHIDDTHDAIATSDTHVLVYTIHLTLIKGNQIVFSIQRVRNNLGRDQLIVRKHLQLVITQVSGVFRQFA